MLALHFLPGHSMAPATGYVEGVCRQGTHCAASVHYPSAGSALYRARDGTVAVVGASGGVVSGGRSLLAEGRKIGLSGSKALVDAGRPAVLAWFCFVKIWRAGIFAAERNALPFTAGRPLRVPSPSSGL